MPRHFLSKDFKIWDLDHPNNPTSHYGACHFGYSLALSGKKESPIIKICLFVCSLVGFIVWFVGCLVGQVDGWFIGYFDGCFWFTCYLVGWSD